MFSCTPSGSFYKDSSPYHLEHGQLGRSLGIKREPNAVLLMQLPSFLYSRPSIIHYAGRPGEEAIELARLIERGLRDSRAVDQEALVVVSGRKVTGGMACQLLGLSSFSCFPAFPAFLLSRLERGLGGGHPLLT